MTTGAVLSGGLVRRRVRVRGVVQGVGFRPFVYSLASELGLAGEVSNDSEGVLALVQGEPVDVDAFCDRVRADAPPLSDVGTVEWHDEPVLPGTGFAIAASTGGTGRTLVPPDVATCDACLAELTDPADRRYRHPFISCTACGPRFTIVTGLPYDRPTTTMGRFPMCERCRAEYTDPADRRFHAQPIACHDCGPVLELVPGGTLREAALAEARALLAAGRVVAVKGLGGYHLACDASNPTAVARLRERKHRGDKPFALLVPDLETARAIAHVDEAEARLLTSTRRPIVLVRRRTTGPGVGSVAREVAPGNADLGLMLPPTALHHLLLGLPDDPAGPRVLVLTSANLSGEPIVTDDAAAVERLGGIADAWLRHDRGIHVPCDDSVIAVVDGEELPVRRSRGYAPMPVPLPVDVRPALAVGGDLKNTFCVASGRYAWLSGHVGDMDDLTTQQAFDRATGHLTELVSVDPELLVADRHPAYRSTRWAQRATTSAAPFPAARALVTVQHHHAHVAAVMAEHGLDGAEPVVGIAFDGTGYGTDGAIWGGEVLLADYTGFRRYAHLAYVPLPGGDAAVHRPYRMALAHLHAAGLPWVEDLPCVAACPPPERTVLARQLECGLGCVPTSSAGRLFDAVAALAGVRQVVDYEAQAAMELQALAVPVIEAGADEGTGGYPLPLLAADTPAGPRRWDVGALIRAVVTDVRAGVPAGLVGARFHRGLADAVVDVARQASADAPGRPVVLSGGVFANTVLLRLVLDGLRHAGIDVVRHRRVPPNDGGLALGQVVVGARASRPMDCSTGRSTTDARAT
ncbi:MAG TPA: carbamoyltransferase HypF [Kineosporiaceae bacterium]